MKVICTDGTSIECASFQAVDSGILLFDEAEPDDEEHTAATGFVPITELRYVLPDEATAASQPAGTAQPQQSAPPVGAPGGRPGQATGTRGQQRGGQRGQQSTGGPPGQTGPQQR